VFSGAYCEEIIVTHSSN